MTPDKKTARSLVGKNLLGTSEKDFLYAYRNAVATFRQIASHKDVRSALLYKTIPKWYEVDLSDLEKDFPNVEFGYISPVADAQMPQLLYDLIIVPMYGHNGFYRLGHGAGWYDRFLATQPEAITIGVGLEAGKIDFSPEPHDIQLDYVVTDTRISGPR